MFAFSEGQGNVDDIVGETRYRLTEDAVNLILDLSPAPGEKVVSL